MKFTIRNESEKTDVEALQMVIKVLEMGFISGEGRKRQHCYITGFKDDHYVYCKFNGINSETMIIRKQENSK